MCEGSLSQQGRRHHYSVNIHYIQSLASFCKINRKLFAERQNAQWPGYLHQDKMKSNGLHDSGLTRWRALAEGDSLLLGSTPPASTPTVLCFPPHSTYPNCPPATTAASTLQIAIFVTVSIDVEKAIIWASRSGNRVLVEVGQRRALFLERSHPAEGVGGNEFQRGRVGGLCWLFYLHLLCRLLCFVAKTTLPPDRGCPGLKLPVPLQLCGACSAW